MSYAVFSLFLVLTVSIWVNIVLKSFEKCSGIGAN